MQFVRMPSMQIWMKRGKSRYESSVGSGMTLGGESDPVVCINHHRLEEEYPHRVVIAA